MGADEAHSALLHSEVQRLPAGIVAKSYDLGFRVSIYITTAYGVVAPRTFDLTCSRSGPLKDVLSLRVLQEYILIDLKSVHILQQGFVLTPK